MAIFFCKEFIRDLAENPDPHFAGKVMAKICGADGSFEPAKEDHRFKGIEGGFIRYISQRPNYYRAIYIRRGDDVYWYRAGRHHVEDRLEPPADLVVVGEVGASPAGVDAMEKHRYPRYTKSVRPRYLREVIASRTLIPHKHLVLVSPSLTKTMIAPTGPIGILTDRAQQLGAYVTVITRPPRDSDIEAYRWFASRGVELRLHSNLNARLYYFEVDSKRLDSELAHIKSIAIIGSAELTESGFNYVGSGAQQIISSVTEELCYEIAESDIEGAMEFCLELTDATVDFDTFIAQRHI